MGYDDFSELVERACFNGWRSVVGRDDHRIDFINSIVFTRHREELKWEFSFGLRYGKTWCQATCDMKPLNYDVLDIGPAGTYEPDRDMSPENKAQDMAMLLLADVRDKLKGM